jgi:glutamate-1-semialdehyde 2,1-aminomutase
VARDEARLPRRVPLPAERPRTGSEAAAGGNALLDRLIHLYALNRGILLTPFHNMALMSPATSEEDVDRHTAVSTRRHASWREEHLAKRS